MADSKYKKAGPASIDTPIETSVTSASRLGGAISSILILLTLGLTTYSVFMRYVLNRPPVWIDELIGYLLVAIVMIGVSEGYRLGSHISIDLLTEGLSPRWRRARWVWSDLCVLAFSIVLGVSTWEAIEFAHSFGSYSSGAIEIQTWIPQVPMLVGAVMLGIISLVRLVGRFLDGREQ